MRKGHGYLEDTVLVLGGAVVIAAAWVLYWQAGLIVAGLVCMLMAIVAYRHHDHHQHVEPPQPEHIGAAAWRFPSTWNQPHGTGQRSGAQH